MASFFELPEEVASYQELKEYRDEEVQARRETTVLRCSEDYSSGDFFDLVVKEEALSRDEDKYRG